MSVHKRELQQETESQAVDEVTWSAPQTGEVDDILDEIDAVLEVNAEEFVRSFVQKGGQ